MKILLINTYDNYGGAALACVRLLQALNTLPDVEAKLLVLTKHLPDAHIAGIAQGFPARHIAFARFALERYEWAWGGARDASVKFAFSQGTWGQDISQHPWVREADVLHLHWINFGFLGIKQLARLFALPHKRLVWTLHDMWAFTGGCHYTGDCDHYQQACGNCPMLRRPRPQDWSHDIWQQKERLFSRAPHLQIVTCSQWLGDRARDSALLRRAAIQAIPNPIDIAQFKPDDTAAVRHHLGVPQAAFVVLFGAMNLADPRKGFAYLREALACLAREYLTSEAEAAQWLLLSFGKADEALLANLPFAVRHMGVLPSPERVIEAYQAASIFVLPSLEDNLPNTVMEALACGTPVAAFATGGVPELVRHAHEGYLAAHTEPKLLAQAIWQLYQNYRQGTPYQQLRQQARQKAEKDYAPKVIAQKYLDLYQQTIASP